jgi:hypothetical protein
MNPLVLQINSPHIVVTSFDFFIDSTAQIKALSGQVPRKTTKKNKISDDQVINLLGNYVNRTCAKVNM